jgi:hypothetical protein
MKTLNPRCFGVWGVIGKKVEAKNPNGVSAKCAIVDFFKNLFDTIFCKTFFVCVFELPSLRTIRKRDKTKTKVEEKLTNCRFFCRFLLGKAFDMDFLQKYVSGVLNCPYRETPNNLLKKAKEQKRSRQVGGCVWELADVRGGGGGP